MVLIHPLFVAVLEIEMYLVSFIYSFIISKAYFSCRDAHRNLLHSMHFLLKVLVHLSELDDL